MAEKKYKYVDPEVNPFGFHEQVVPIAKIKRNKKNPRKISGRDKKGLDISVRKFGLIDKPILNSDYSLIAGHQRLTLLEERGVTEVVCQVPEIELTKSEEEELLLRHNRNQGEFDWDMLRSEFDEKELLTVGFDPAELQKGVKIEHPKDENGSPVYPLVPKMNEKYDYVLILADNHTEVAFLQSFFELDTVTDYKSSRVGLGRVVTFAKFKKIIDERGL